MATAEDFAAPPPSAASPDARTRVPLRVVRVMSESRQALLFDRERGTHVLVDVGASIAGYKVDAIDDDAVTLSSETGAQVVLAAPDRAWRRRARDRGASRFHTGLDREEVRGPSDPYADPASAPQDPYGAATVPADPYAPPAIRSVQAPRPIAAGEDGVRVAQAPAVNPNSPDESTPYDTVPAPSAPANARTAVTVPPLAITVAPSTDAQASATLPSATSPSTSSPSPLPSVATSPSPSPTVDPAPSPSVATALPPSPSPTAAPSARSITSGPPIIVGSSVIIDPYATGGYATGEYAAPVAAAPSAATASSAADADVHAPFAPSSDLDAASNVATPYDNATPYDTDPGAVAASAATAVASDPGAAPSVVAPSAASIAMPSRDTASPAAGTELSAAMAAAAPSRTAKSAAAPARAKTAAGARRPTNAEIDRANADLEAAASMLFDGAPLPTHAPAAPSATLPKSDVQAALRDFGKLAGSIRADFAPSGLAIETVAPDSIFARAGLRAGDTVTAVDGVPMKSIDDAAGLYARAATARTVTVQVVRAGKPLALTIAIQ